MTHTPRVQLDDRVRGLPTSATLAVNERCAALVRAGRQVFRLGFGQSPFPAPAPVIEALRRSAHERDYLPVRGLLALRQAVAEYHRRCDGIDCDADDVLIGPGSKELMFLLQLVHDGDILVPTPAWVSYVPQARLAGRTVHQVATEAEDGWRVRPEAIESLCRTEPDRPRVLILNYPSNPTGSTLREDDLRALADVARTYRLLVLSDEIYGALDHQGAHRSMARFYPEGTLIASGLSKWCGVGGWRLGTLVLPRGLRALGHAIATAASETYSSVSAPIQHAAVRAFQGGPEIERYLGDARRILAALGQWLTSRLRAAGIACTAPEGGFYLFPDFGPQRERLAARGITTSAALCERLLEDTGVALLAGHDFGRPENELTCRLAYVDFDGSEVLAALAQLPPAALPDESFVRTYCPRVCEAADRLARWVHDA